jgi:hypothetical protein
MKLTRKQIKEGLEATPIDTLLMGSPKTLTAKQKEFARQVAMGKPKAEAYRTAYDTNTTANAQAVEGYRLSNNPHISLMIESMKVSLEAQKYLLPAHLRALTIQKLTEKALDPDVNHAQQIKALELLGKITEVALFSERKEIITTDTSATAKDRLIQSLAQAIRSSAHISTDKKQEADDLLAEITGGSLANPEPQTVDQAPEDIIDQDHQAKDHLLNDPEAEEIENGLTPPDPTPQNVDFFTVPPTHTIPHKQSAPISETPPLSIPNAEGEGVSNFWEQFEEPAKETPPLVDSGSPTPPIDISNPNWRES